ncbi:P-loop containing nucleoside triphosphate hydrolase protein [Aspergillus heterothallicus]
MSEATSSTSLTLSDYRPHEGLICYGSLYEGRVAHRGSKSLFQRFCKSAGTLERFALSRKDDDCFILQDQKQTRFAVLDTSSTAALNCLQGLDGLLFCAIPRPLTLDKGTSSLVNVSINIYGPFRHHRQHLDIVEPGMKYDNPQYFTRSDVQTEMHQFIKPLHRPKPTLRSVQTEIDRIFDTLDETYAEGDAPFPEKLITPLLNVDMALNDPEKCIFEQAPGGIIADVMGLGKTLTMLSAILFSLDDAQEFMLSTSLVVDEGRYVVPTKSTLVVVPSTQLIEGWMSEIDRHIAPNSIHISVFHGPQKQRQAKEFPTSDIVLTTYSTLAADRKSSHWIRNPASKQFRAVDHLHGDRRWCLTGTPIQNRIEDLGSLVTFLKTPPFNQNAQSKFKRHIVDPLYSDGDDPRTKQASHIITVKKELVALSLSPTEKLAYEKILDETKREMEMLVSTGRGKRKYIKLFTAMHRLRMLCVQGVASKEMASRVSCLSPIASSLASDVDMYCELCHPDESLDLIKAGNAFCPDCGRLFSNTQGSSESGSVSPRPIVFSGWTQTLDILGLKLEALGINYVRIDGKVSSADRTRRLNEFQSLSNISVLLMTYGTGAVGLNLTAANRIHLLGPQWNPSVEEQAIGRAVRLGQAREVTVIRYIMRNTVEENIVAVQKNKKQLASLTLESNSSETLGGRTEVSLIIHHEFPAVNKS